MALAGVGLAAWAVWEHALEDRFVPRNWGVVEPGRIYRSGQLSEHVVEPTLRKHDIRVIVNLGEDLRGKARHDAERLAAGRLGIERVTYFLKGDGTGDVESYANAIEQIDRAGHAGKPVLVHCAAGTQRTGAAVAFYRVLVQDRPGSEALREMEHYGCKPRGKDRPLCEYVNANMRALAERLVARGVIERVPNPLPVLRP